MPCIVFFLSSSPCLFFVVVKIKGVKGKGMGKGQARKGGGKCHACKGKTKAECNKTKCVTHDRSHRGTRQQKGREGRRGGRRMVGIGIMAGIRQEREEENTHRE